MRIGTTDEEGKGDIKRIIIIIIRREITNDGVWNFVDMGRNDRNGIVVMRR
jgi:hypothetical protein